MSDPLDDDLDGGPPVEEPPVDEPPVGEPPAEDPPTAEPPVQEPPEGDPPAESPPVEEPLALLDQEALRAEEPIEAEAEEPIEPIAERAPGLVNEPAMEPAEAAALEADRAARAEGGTLPASWRVHLPVFEGPLDLLLHLIKLNKVEITDIPVSTICDQFHEYLGLMGELNLDVAGEYIYEAAVLIHLKSKMLLPRAPQVEGAQPEDPRQELVERLLEYRRLKEAAQSMAEVDRLRMGIWTRRPQPLPQAPQEEDEEIDLGEISLFDLLGALKKVLVRYEREHPPPLQLAGEVFSVRDQFDRLLRHLDAGRPFDLVADLRLRTCRAEAIAEFLAVLELARLNLIRVHQTEGGEILLYRTTRELGETELEAIGR